MKQKITGFHRDGQGHWVADLQCGHAQHMRHDPPWQSRPWVETELGRARKIGVALECSKCRDRVTSATYELLKEKEQKPQ